MQIGDLVIGDWVKVTTTRWDSDKEQQSGHVGQIVRFYSDNNIPSSTKFFDCIVSFGDVMSEKAYKFSDLEFISGAMVEPEFSLDEIEQGQALVNLLG